MYNLKLNNYNLNPKDSTIYTPKEVSQFIYELLKDKFVPNEAYFCWEKSIKIGWAEFQSNWTNINRIEFEYEELEKGNKVINIITHDQAIDAFI